MPGGFLGVPVLAPLRTALSPSLTLTPSRSRLLAAAAHSTRFLQSCGAASTLSLQSAILPPLLTKSLPGTSSCVLLRAGTATTEFNCLRYHRSATCSLTHSSSSSPDASSSIYHQDCRSSTYLYPSLRINLHHHSSPPLASDDSVQARGLYACPGTSPLPKLHSQIPQGRRLAVFSWANGMNSLNPRTVHFRVSFYILRPRLPIN